MNILGYISAILILIGIAFQSYYSNWFTDRKLQDSLKGYHMAFRSLEKEYVNQAFNSIPEKKEHKCKTDGSNDTTKMPILLKKELTPYCMRLNLWLYKNVDVNSDFNFSPLEKLISLLYSDKLIPQKNIPKFTKNLLLAIQAKKTETIHLEQLKFKNLEDQEIYYRMLKGKEDCYPSFLNYVCIRADSNPKICVACADYVILTSLFNEKIAETLTLKKQTPLEQVAIDANSFNKIISSYNIKKEGLPNLSLKHKKSNLKEITISSKEHTTKIQLNQKMQLNFKSAKKNNLARKS